MGLFGNLFKKQPELEPVNVGDDAIVAVADGKLIDITTVPDPVFAQKMMGDGVAFKFDADSMTICAPANWNLTVLFPTGHAFGVTMKNGVELLVHIGINTVEANGDGFKVLNFKQGDEVKAGDPIVTVDFKKLGAKYDMSTMLIVTNANGQTITFRQPGDVKRGESVLA